MEQRRISPTLKRKEFMRVPPHLYQKYQVSSSNQKTRKIYQILYYEKQNNVHTSLDGLLWKLISCQASFPQQSQQAKGRSRRMQMLPYPEDLVKEQNVDLSLLLMTHQTKGEKIERKVTGMKLHYTPNVIQLDENVIQERWKWRVDQ